MKPYYTDERAGIVIYLGDCREILPTNFTNNTNKKADSDSCDLCDSWATPFSAIVTDPPYGFGFMGKGWDRAVPGVEFWTGFLGCCLPGAHLVAFGGPRTSHRLVCAIEDAGWEVRDSLAWIFGQGFPKSADVSKMIDKAAGVKRKMAAQWAGWGTALKPAIEPICLARKPLGEKTVAANVLKYGCGGLNIEGSRIATADNLNGGAHSVNLKKSRSHTFDSGSLHQFCGKPYSQPTGRFPANVLLDEEAARLLDEQSGFSEGDGHPMHSNRTASPSGAFGVMKPFTSFGHADSGGASRFFYTAKASGSDRGNHTKGALALFGVEEEEFRNTHPTVKPTSLMRYLVRLVAPPGALNSGGTPLPQYSAVWDPFMGSGTTLVACKELGFRCVGVELEEGYCEIAAKRVERVKAVAHELHE